MRCFPRENSEKIKVGTFGGLPGPVCMGCRLKMGLRGQKAKNAECVGMCIWGSESVKKNPKKMILFGKAKSAFVKKKLGP